MLGTDQRLQLSSFSSPLVCCLQGVLVYMFRELMDFCVRTISTSEHYSLAIQNTPTASYVILCFWADTVLHRVCIGGAPRGKFLPRKIITIVASFLTLFEVMPSCVCLIGFGDKLVDCFTTCLPGLKPPSAINSFGPNEFERTLTGPTTQVIERHDYRSILDYLLMKLRTALDKDWLHKLPLLHKVISFLLFFRQRLKLSLYFIPFVLFYTFCSELDVLSSTLIELLSSNWNDVREHLNQVARLPVYRFHMREVIIIITCVSTIKTQILIFFFSAPIPYTNVSA